MSPGSDPSVAELGAELAGNLQRVAELREKVASLRGLTERQLNWKPGPRRWSVGECVLHMLETNVGYSGEIDAKLRELREKGKVAGGPFRYGWFSRWFVGMVEPPAKRKLPAPKAFAPPRRPATARDVEELVESVERLGELNRAAAGLDLRPKIVSPATKLVRLEVGMALRMLGAHTLRHLQQADAVMGTPGFPGAARGEET